MVTQLKKRIEKRGIDDVEASHSGGFVYLEKNHRILNPIFSKIKWL